MWRVLFLAMLCIGVLCNGVRATAAQPQYLQVQMRSSLLSQFWGQEVDVDAHVLLPDSFYKQPNRRYPVIYWISSFDGTGELDLQRELQWQHAMRTLKQEFILVLMDGMFNGVHQEFADSANNGPWGRALTEEFIPATEAKFRAIGTAQTRFVAGHSSGGWSALWLQVTYPQLFDAEWSIAPDPVDFHDFTGPDLTRDQNFYQDASGHEYGFERSGERDTTTLRKFVQRDGWARKQMHSFETVFSPRGKDGNPQPLFDRQTGAIDPAVAAYWESHYDIARVLAQNWNELAPKLRGKIHIMVGTHDTFHLDRSVRLLDDEFALLGGDGEEFDFVPDGDHWSVLYWHGGAEQYIVTEAAAMLRANASN